MIAAAITMDVLSALPAAIAVYDRDLRLVFASDGLLAQAGLERRDLPIGSTLRDTTRMLAYRGLYGPGDPEARLEAVLRLDRSAALRRIGRATDGRVFDLISMPMAEGGFVSLATDVTAFARGEAQALGVARQVQGVLERLHGGVAVFAQDRRIALFNAAYESLIGASPGMLRAGMTLEEIYAVLIERSEYANAERADFVRSRLQLDRSIPQLMVRERPTGQVLRTRSTPTADGGFVLEVDDLTDLKRAEDDASRRAALLDGVLATLPHGVCVFGPDKRVSMVNDAYRRLLGDAAPSVGESLDGMIERRFAAGEYPDTTIEEVRRQRWAFLGQGQADWVRRRPNGTMLVIRMARLPDGGHLSVVTDVTDLARAQEETRVQAARHQVMLANIRHGVTLFDAEGRLIAANELAAKFCGLTLADFPPGIRIEEVRQKQAARGEFGAPVATQVFVQARTKTFGADSYTRQRPDGTLLEITTDPTPEGGFVRTFTDVTQERRVMAELERAKDAAEEANRAKSRFLTTMTHELRTPLNAVIGFSDALLAQARSGTAQPGDTAEFSRAINEAGRHLLSLIDDILDVARAEGSGMATNMQSLDLPSVVAGVARVMRAQADEAGITLSVEIDDCLPRVFADEKRLRQVMINLVTNAVKFTEKDGSVHIAARIATGGLLIAVTDTGIGIATEDIDRAFEPFVQLEASLSRRYGGSGLGLHLARTLARAMGFELTLASEQGRGTTATLTIPADRLVAEETPAMTDTPCVIPHE